MDEKMVECSLYIQEHSEETLNRMAVEKLVAFMIEEANNKGYKVAVALLDMKKEPDDDRIKAYTDIESIELRRAVCRKIRDYGKGDDE